MGSSSKNVKTHDTPAESSMILHADEDGANQKHAWNYEAVVGCLDYLQAMTQPDLASSVHQCACFCNNPKLLHEQGFKRICRYLYLTRDCGLVFKPKLTDGFKCYVDADWAENWLKTRPNDKTGALSRTGDSTTYAYCPIMWDSKMQSLVALSTTEAELTAMSTMLREVIHLQNLFLELHGCTFLFPSQNLKWFVILLKTMSLVLRLPNRITRSAPGPNTFQCGCFTFMITLKRGSSQLSMSHQNISLPIFLQNLWPMINTCTYAIKSWGGHQLHLLTTRECEVIVVPLPKCLPTSIPVLPILLRAILYFLQYIQSFPPIVHLFYLTRFSIRYIH